MPKGVFNTPLMNKAFGQVRTSSTGNLSKPRGTSTGGSLAQMAPTSPMPSYDTGGSYGGSYGGGGVASVAPTPPRLTDDQWLGQDSQYKSAISALEQKLRDFTVENESTRKKGIADYDDSLLRLGWMKDTNDWNQEDRTTAYGNAYQGQMGDFASRGLLQSTLYDQARTDLLGNFNRQKGDMDTSHTNFLEDLARALSGQKSQTQLGKDQARVEALARRAAAESGVG